MFAERDKSVWLYSRTLLLLQQWQKKQKKFYIGFFYKQIRVFQPQDVQIGFVRKMIYFLSFNDIIISLRTMYQAELFDFLSKTS